METVIAQSQDFETRRLEIRAARTRELYELLLIDELAMRKRGIDLQHYAKGSTGVAVTIPKRGPILIMFDDKQFVMKLDEETEAAGEEPAECAAKIGRVAARLLHDPFAKIKNA